MRKDGFLKLFFTMPIFGYAKMLGVKIIDSNATKIESIKALMALDLILLIPPLIMGMIVLPAFSNIFLFSMIFLFLHAFGLQMAVKFKNRR